MRIVQLTAGTGTWYCGTCLRDNGLVLALREAGHDATLVPLYLPLAVDEADASAGSPVFLGGIGTWLAHHSAAWRALGGWLEPALSTRAVLDRVSARSGMTDPADLGDLTVSMLRGPAGPQRRQVARLVHWLAGHARPDVVMLSNALLLGLVPALVEAGLPVVCTLQGEDEFLDALPEPHRTRAWDLLAEQAAGVARFIAVSRFHGELMVGRARLPAERLRVVPNGIHLAGFEVPGAGHVPGPPTIGYLARMCRDKGLEVLVDAFIELRGRSSAAAEPEASVRLTVVGAVTGLDEPLVADMRRRLEAVGLADSVSWHPNVSREEKQRLLRSFTVFSVPAVYQESFGLYVLEALACGVPVVEPDHAGLGELVRDTGGGLLCAPGDPGALADGLSRLLGDAELRHRLGRAGRDAVVARYSASAMADAVAEVLRSAVAAGGVSRGGRRPAAR